MTRSKPRPVVVALIVSLFVVLTTPAHAGDPPRSMAAAGDSITRAFNATLQCFLRDCLPESWSTGDGGVVWSHYVRLLVMGADIEGRNYNVARTGAKMVELTGQLEVAGALGAEYVTILLGANDACTSTIPQMTPVATFRDQFEQALRGFLERPGADARVLVASVPNLYHLWALFHDDPYVRFVWRTARICQSMLSERNTEQDRLTVLSRIVDFNVALAEVCAQFERCRFDEWAVFSYAFSPSDVSVIDFFHPSRIGQDVLAEVTWQAGWWPW